MRAPTRSGRTPGASCGCVVPLYRTFLFATNTRVCAFVLSQRTPRRGLAHTAMRLLHACACLSLPFAWRSCLFDSHSTKDEWVDYELGTKVRGNGWCMHPRAYYTAARTLLTWHCLAALRAAVACSAL